MLMTVWTCNEILEEMFIWYYCAVVPNKHFFQDFFNNSKDFVSQLLENLEKMFPR